jgi:hypothetical protein
MATRLQIAKADIVRHFEALPHKVLKLADLKAILNEQRAFWRLAQNTTTADFIAYLIEHAKLKRLDFPFPYRPETRYTWGDVPLLEVLLSLKPGAYFSHYTAVRLHGLTEQVPKTIYLNHEQPPRPPGSALTQASIDRAFRGRPRISQNLVEYGDARICLINGKNTGDLGVVTDTFTYDDTQPVRVRLTNIERTLIDITVRPMYAGGIREVLKAFQLAKDTVSVNRLAAMLKQLDHLYPYHQAIGFYLSRAGYKDSLIALLRNFPMDFDFYLSYQMGKTDYIQEWRLHVPQTF